MSKYTPWFLGDVKPVRVGWYQLKGAHFWENRNNRRSYVMRHWSGRGWEWASPFSGRLVSAVVSVDDYWRGLAKKPA